MRTVISLALAVTGLCASSTQAAAASTAQHVRYPLPLFAGLLTFLAVLVGWKLMGWYLAMRARRRLRQRWALPARAQDSLGKHQRTASYYFK